MPLLRQQRRLDITPMTTTKRWLRDGLIFAGAMLFAWWEHSRLTAKQGELERLLQQHESLLAKVSAASAQQPLPSSAFLASTEQSLYLPLELKTISDLKFDAIGQNGKLTPSAIALLGMSSLEATRVQDLFDQWTSRMREYGRENLHEIDPQQIDDVTVGNFLRTHPGQQTVYQIPPLSEADQRELLQTLGDNLVAALGQDRAEILQQHFRDVKFLWFAYGGKATIAFSANTGRGRNTLPTNFMLWVQRADYPAIYEADAYRNGVPNILKDIFNEKK